MKKSDLKTGMRVKFRKGEIYLVLKDVETETYGHQDILFVNNEGFMPGSEYHEDLIKMNTTPISSRFDIIEVYTITDTTLFSLNIFDLQIRHSIWIRQEFTEEQKELFKALNLLGFNYVAKDSDGESYAYIEKPHKTSGDTWIDNKWNYLELSNLDKNLFDFIKWEDTEPFEIPA